MLFGAGIPIKNANSFERAASRGIVCLYLGTDTKFKIFILN